MIDLSIAHAQPDLVNSCPVCFLFPSLVMFCQLTPTTLVRKDMMTLGTFGGTFLNGGQAFVYWFQNSVIGIVHSVADKHSVIGTM